MLIKFYGTRGSIPVCEPEYQTFGGNTPSILIQSKNGIGILDAGTGIRNLGIDLINSDEIDSKRIFMLFSHFHWDHIQGFPFFLPAYDKNREIIIAAMGKTRNHGDFKKILQKQMSEEYFPIPMEQMGARMRFLNIESDEFKNELFLIKSNTHILYMQ